MPKSKRQRQEEAIARQEARDDRTDQQQLDRLILAGHGSSREANRLNQRIAERAAEERRAGEKRVKKELDRQEKKLRRNKNKRQHAA